MQDMYSDIGHLASIYNGTGGSSSSPTPNVTLPSAYNNGGIIANWGNLPASQSYSSPAPVSYSSASSTTSAKPSVADWYKTWLGREGDSAGLNYWQSALDKGMDYNTVYGMFQQQANNERNNLIGNSKLSNYGDGTASIGTPIISLPDNFNQMTQGQQEAYQNLLKVSKQSWQDYVPGAQFLGGGNDQFLTGVDPSIARFVAADPEYIGLIGMPDGSYDTGSLQREINRIASKYTEGGSAQSNASLAREQALKMATDNVNWWNAHPVGNDGFLDHVMPYVAGAMAMGALAMGGAFGGAAGATGAAEGGLGATAGASGVGGVGALEGAGGALGGIGGAAGSAGGGVGALEGLGGVGSMIGIEGGAPAVVTIGGGSAAGGGLGAIGSIGAGLGGIGILDNIFTPQPVDTGSLSQVPDNINAEAPEDMQQVVIGPPSGSGTPTDGSYIPPILPLPVDVGGVFNPNTGTGDNGTGSGTPGSGTGVGTIPWGPILGGIGDVIGGVVDHNKNTQDAAYWQHYMDQLTDMYKPGSPEAELMRHKLEALDAASGRNSQYGIREQNLAAMLAAQRAQIMTSPAFYQMGAASRGHYDNSLNSLFSALGGGSRGGGLGSILDLISSGLGSSGLFNMFGPGIIGDL